MGGIGSVPAWSETRLQLNLSAGIAQLIPQYQIVAVGKNLDIAIGQDNNLIVQGQHSLAIKDGLPIAEVTTCCLASYGLRI